MRWSALNAKSQSSQSSRTSKLSRLESLESFRMIYAVKPFMLRLIKIIFRAINILIASFYACLEWRNEFDHWANIHCQIASLIASVSVLQEIFIPRVKWSQSSPETMTIIASSACSTRPPQTFFILKLFLLRMKDIFSDESEIAQSSNNLECVSCSCYNGNCINCIFYTIKLQLSGCFFLLFFVIFS